MLEGRWPPEQLEGRIRFERPGLVLSDMTICRAIGSGALDRCIGGRKASVGMRCGGRRRKRRDGSELRGKIKVSHGLSERPAAEGPGRASATGRATPLPGEPAAHASSPWSTA